MKTVAEQIESVVNDAVSRLLTLSNRVAGTPPAEGEWSKKQLLGHLIDSAANNHQRFVRAPQVEKLIFPGYDQMPWVNIQAYQEANWHSLVELWRAYNLHLAHIIRHLPGSVLRRECIIGGNPPASLAWIVSDYLVHLMHHLYDLLPDFERLVVVHFSAEQTDGVLDLIVPIQREEFGIAITAQDQPDLRDIPNYYQTGKGNFWVARHQGAVVGSVALLDIGRGNGPAAPGGTGRQQAALRKMFVKQAYRGGENGVAKLLLDSLLEWARAQAIEEIYLGTTDKFLAAHRFYEKHGFAEVPKASLPASFPVMSVASRFYRITV
jgi:N-acetylglutamate synthase-like GNAT family acetyltransferase